MLFAFSSSKALIRFWAVSKMVFRQPSIGTSTTNLIDLQLFSTNTNLVYSKFPRFNFLSAIRAEGEPVTFQVGGDAGGRATFLAGVPGCSHSLVYELSEILWGIVVVNAEAAEFLLDLADLDG